MSNQTSVDSGESSSYLQTPIVSTSPRVLSLTVWVGVLLVMTSTATAQSNVGDVYCGTGVETGITIVFGAIAGLGLPATGYYLTKSGLDYMRAGGNPEKKNTAKQELVMSGIGFGIIVIALISPELIDNIGSQMGFSFSDCVKPF
ncbi:pilin [Halobacteria archaeon AArc-xg1-1]|uniref:Pilin n=2 Tax=Natronoglomus mannanivorans TaxID=2979990 RepID=A0AAP2Z153_9EURY|nr:pilin [Halobacteria archaeon AArc-xg1-1]